MGLPELLALAGSISLLSGWRLYLTVFATGLAMRTGWIDLPQNLEVLNALANPFVLGISATGAVAEFFADKIAWLDSFWDAVHTVIRPIGGALLTLAIVDASDPAWQIVAFLLGGGGALVSHGTKATARAAINTSPEPFSNVVMSTTEDVLTGGLLVLAIANPYLAMGVTVLLLVTAITLLAWGWRVLRRARAKLVDDPERNARA